MKGAFSLYIFYGSSIEMETLRALAKGLIRTLGIGRWFFSKLQIICFALGPVYPIATPSAC